MQPPEILRSPNRKIPQTETKIVLREGTQKPRDQKSAEKVLKQSKSLSAVKLQLSNNAISAVKLKRSPTATRLQKNPPSLE